jgi:hypothetical protein
MTLGCHRLQMKNHPSCHLIKTTELLGLFRGAWERRRMVLQSEIV